MTMFKNQLKKTGRKITLPVLLMTLALHLTLVLFCTDKGGEIIEKIEGYAITTQDFEEHYNSTVEIVSRLANVDKKSLGKFICKPDDKVKMQISQRLLPENSYKIYRDLRMVEQVARQDGFLERPVIKRILEQKTLETIAQLYLQEKMEKYLKITTEQKESRCAQMRQGNPRRFGHLPYDQCVYYAEQSLKQEIFHKRKDQLVDEIKERVQVKKGKINKDDYLSKSVTAYISLKKSGGCAEEPKKTDDKKTDDKKKTSGKKTGEKK